MVTHPTLIAAFVVPAQTVFDSAMRALADPNVAYVLLVLGFLGLFLELSHPGTGIPGAIGVACLFLAAIGLAQRPFEWQGAVLILLAFLLFAADLFLPSLGALTVAGLALLVGGSFLLFDPSRGIAVAQPLVWSVAAALVVLFALIGGLALAVLRQKPATGREGLIGAVGTVRQALNPDGLVFVNGELWLATASGDSPAAAAPIETRVPVTVTSMDGLRLFVRRATASEVADAGVAVIGDRRPAPTAAVSLADAE
jgi:membrane-bound serine protease (ClpP class)